MLVGLIDAQNKLYLPLVSRHVVERNSMNMQVDTAVELHGHVYE
jgi:hypothetical protein